MRTLEESWISNHWCQGYRKGNSWVAWDALPQRGFPSHLGCVFINVKQDEERRLLGQSDFLALPFVITP